MVSNIPLLYILLFNGFQNYLYAIFFCLDGFQPYLYSVFFCLDVFQPYPYSIFFCLDCFQPYPYSLYSSVQMVSKPTLIYCLDGFRTCPYHSLFYCLDGFQTYPYSLYSSVQMVSNPTIFHCLDGFQTYPYSIFSPINQEKWRQLAKERELVNKKSLENNLDPDSEKNGSLRPKQNVCFFVFSKYS